MVDSRAEHRMVCASPAHIGASCIMPKCEVLQYVMRGDSTIATDEA